MKTAKSEGPQMSTVWAVERFEDGHWCTLVGGLTKDDAFEAACKMWDDDESNQRYSIAEYETAEGSSAISREEVTWGK